MPDSTNTIRTFRVFQPYRSAMPAQTPPIMRLFERVSVAMTPTMPPRTARQHR
jgi:hypothetical protein